MNFHLYYTTDPNYAGKFPLVLECLPATCMFTPHRPRGVSTIYDYNYCRWWPTASSGEPQSTANPPKTAGASPGARARGSKREVLMRYKSPLPYSTEQQESDLHVYRSISDVDVFFFCVASKTLPDFSNAIPIREKNLALGEREEKKKGSPAKKENKIHHLMLHRNDRHATHARSRNPQESLAAPLKSAVRTGIICISIFLSWRKKILAGGSRRRRACVLLHCGEKKKIENRKRAKLPLQ